MEEQKDIVVLERWQLNNILSCVAMCVGEPDLTAASTLDYLEKDIRRNGADEELVRHILCIVNGQLEAKGID